MSTTLNALQAARTPESIVVRSGGIRAGSGGGKGGDGGDGGGGDGGDGGGGDGGGGDGGGDGGGAEHPGGPLDEPRTLGGEHSSKALPSKFLCNEIL